MEIKNLRALNTNVTSDSTGNFYPRHVVEKAVEAFLKKNEGRQILGELRPKNYHIPNIKRQMQVLGSDMSHEILDLRFDGDVLVADIRVLDLPAGDLLKKLIPLDTELLYSQSKEELGFMLGLRSLVSYPSDMQDMQSKTVESLEIITFDVIFDPLKIADHFPGVLFYNSDSEPTIPRTWWERDKDTPGTIHATYAGSRLTMKPVGSSEWDGLVDGAHVFGSDSQEEIEECLINYVLNPEPIAGRTLAVTPTVTVKPLET